MKAVRGTLSSCETNDKISSNTSRFFFRVTQICMSRWQNSLFAYFQGVGIWLEHNEREHIKAWIAEEELSWLFTGDDESRLGGHTKPRNLTSLKHIALPSPCTLPYDRHMISRALVVAQK